MSQDTQPQRPPFQPLSSNTIDEPASHNPSRGRPKGSTKSHKNRPCMVKKVCELTDSASRRRTLLTHG